MRLPFKRQSTDYTCVQATQAIAINYILGTDFSDLDVVMASDHGYPLNTAIVQIAAANTRRAGNGVYNGQSINIYVTIAMLKKLDHLGRLPSYEDAVLLGVKINEDNMANYESDLRKNPYRKVFPDGNAANVRMTKQEIDEALQRSKRNYREEIEKLYKELKSEQMGGFYRAVCDHLEDALFRPIGRKFYVQGISDKTEYSGIAGLSKNTLLTEPYEKAMLEGGFRDDTAVFFGMDRREIGLRQNAGSHSWIIDSVGDGEIVLLDTNHFAYGHGPEIVIPFDTFMNINTHGMMVVHRKES